MDESRILISLLRNWNENLDNELDIARDFITNAVSKGTKDGLEVVYEKKIESYRAENQCLKSQVAVLKAQLELQ